MDEPTDGRCIQDLPQEILEYVFSLLSPYRDYHSVMLVCKLWHKIVFVVRQHEVNRFKLAIGDSHLQWCSLVTDSGTDQPSIAERYSHSACYHDKRVYVFGGCTATGTTFNDLWELDLGKRQWRRPWAVGTYPTPKACATLVAYRDSLILFGGWSHPNPYPLHQAARFFNQLHVYEPASCRWSHMAPPTSPPGIAGHGANIIGDTMIVFGGSHQLISCNDVWVLDLIKMEWTQKVLEDGPPPRYGHSQVVLDDSHILVIGGCGGPNMQYNDMWMLKMSAPCWEWQKIDVLQPENAAKQLWCHPACKVGDHVIVLSKTSQRRVRTPPAKPDTAVAAVPDSAPGDGTPAVRSGRPSVRPNAMCDRERLLATLERYETRLRQTRPIHPMYIHTLDVSAAVSDGRVTWRAVGRGGDDTAPQETIFYSMVCGRAELVVFGGIEMGLNSMQRGLKVHKMVSASVHFLRAGRWLR